MRLTLRTLLAYMDDILEPADAQELEHKIAESEFATSLMHRARDVTRRLRLGAPKLEGRGMGMDPNTVAEYLDHALPPEHVPDFEKVCLESDTHLAEVTSCHQILALVLGEPAEVDPRSRQRMYMLAEPVAPVAPPPVNGPVPSPSVSRKSRRTSKSRHRRRRRSSAVPEYLRASAGGRLWPKVAAVAGAVAVVGLVALVIWDPMGLRTRVAVGPAAPPAGAKSAPDTPPSAGSGEPQPPAGDNELDANEQDAQKSAADAAPPVAATDSTTADTNTPEQAQKPLELPAGTDTADNPPATADHTPGEAAAAAPEPPLPAAATPSVAPPAVETSAADSTAAPETPAAGSPPVPHTESPPVESAEGIGRLISNQQIVLRYQPNGRIWERLPAQELLRSGDRLLCLPTYRSNVALSTGISVQLLGGAKVDLEGPDSSGVAGLHVLQGRAVLLTVGKPQSQLRLRLGDQMGLITFGAVDATVAVEVAHWLPDGSDPEKQAGVEVVELYVAGGEIRWQSAASGTAEAVFPAPSHQILSGTPEHAAADGQQAGAMPAWIVEDKTRPIEKQASVFVQDYLVAGQPISQRLNELAVHRRWEIRALAAACLGLIDEFEPVVPLLKDERQQPAWNDLIGSLRAALARGPETAALVREALEKRRGPNAGSDLYRMLWGYTRDELTNGSAAKLVQYLDHEDLDYRVLAYWNLQRSTGASDLYRPEYPAAKRKPFVLRWKKRVEDGLLFQGPRAAAVGA